MSRAPRISSAGQRTAAAASSPVGVGVAGREIGVEHAGPRALHQAHRVAGQPDAGHRLPPSCLPGAVRPAVDQLVGDVIVRLRGVEQRVADRHRHRGTDERDLRHALGMPRRAFEHRERAQRMADQRRVAGARRVEQRGQSSRRSPRPTRARRRPSGRGPAGRRRARCGRDARSSATAAPRRCGRSRRRGRRRPSAARRRSARAGVRVDLVATRSSSVARSRPPDANRRRMRVSASLPAACSARRRSSIRSSGFSRPTDRRIVPSVMPAFARSSADIRKCVVLAGWITSDFASPTLARCEKILSVSMNLRPCARVPLRSKLNTAPQPFGSSRCASA